MGTAPSLASASELGGHRAAWSLREGQQGRLRNKRSVPATDQASNLPLRRPGTTTTASGALRLAQPRCGTSLPGPPQNDSLVYSLQAQGRVLQASGCSCSAAVGPSGLPVSPSGAGRGQGGGSKGPGAAGEGLWPHLHAGAPAPERPTPLCAWPG